jgi:HEPN domain-containing protein
MREDNPQDWAKKADSDLDAAQRLLRGKNQHPDLSCYHSQQCSEKYLKAILVARRIEFPKSHDLVILNQLCLAQSILTAFDEDNLDFLNGFATRARYPGVEPTIEEARRSISIAKSVRKFARSFLGLS